MKYMGSKNRLAKYIIPVIKELQTSNLKLTGHKKSTEKLFIYRG